MANWTEAINQFEMRMEFANSVMFPFAYYVAGGFVLLIGLFLLYTKFRRPTP